MELPVLSFMQGYQIEHFGEFDEEKLRRRLKELEPICSGRPVVIDTETTGLHIRYDKLSAIGVGWGPYVFTMLYTPLHGNVLREFIEKHVRHVIFFNAKFDMHFLERFCEIKWFDLYRRRGLKIEDVMGYVRIVLQDEDETARLKYLAKKYIHPGANFYEKVLKTELRKLEATIKALYKGNPNYPKPTYADVDRDLLRMYLASDVILTDLLRKKCLPAVEARDGWKILKREFELLPYLYETEKIGMRVDLEKLREAREKLQALIRKKKEQLDALVKPVLGETFDVGQHKKIKDYYEKLTGERPESTDKLFLMKREKYHNDPVARLIRELRRLEKWLATYVDRIEEKAKYDGRFYTQLNQFGAVSGRFSSDAQQFPRDAIEEDGEVVYHPRQVFIPSGGGYNAIFYFDWSQVELRMLAEYTLAFGGDLNLCRAYIPFKCVSKKDGREYDLIKDKPYWNSGEWIVPETGEPWKPTDVHGLSTKLAYPEFKDADKDGDREIDKKFKKMRNIGKRYNFMKIYGGGVKKAAEVLDVTYEEAEAFNRGFEEAFPLSVVYANAVINKLKRFPYVKNIYGRRYYLSQDLYKGANYLIQGSCADMMKETMLKVYRMLEAGGYKSRIILTVHDELQVEMWEGEEKELVPKIKAIMEDFPQLRIPIVCEVEYTTTRWSEKKPWEG